MKLKGQKCVIGNVPTFSELTQELSSQERGRKVRGEGKEGEKGNPGDWGGERKKEGKESDKDIYRYARIQNNRKVTF